MDNAVSFSLAQDGDAKTISNLRHDMKINSHLNLRSISRIT